MSIADVAAHGKSDLLVQRAIRGVSYCGFTPNEMIEGMADLQGDVRTMETLGSWT